MPSRAGAGEGRRMPCAHLGTFSRTDRKGPDRSFLAPQGGTSSPRRFVRTADTGVEGDQRLNRVAARIENAPGSARAGFGVCTISDEGPATGQARWGRRDVWQLIRSGQRGRLPAIRRAGARAPLGVFRLRVRRVADVRARPRRHGRSRDSR
jgi:hypothetical protein